MTIFSRHSSDSLTEAALLRSACYAAEWALPHTQLTTTVQANSPAAFWPWQHKIEPQLSGLPGDLAEPIKTTIAELREEASGKKPDEGRLRGGSKSVGRIMEGAAGNLVASRVIAEIAKHDGQLKRWIQAGILIPIRANWLILRALRIFAAGAERDQGEFQDHRRFLDEPNIKFLVGYGPYRDEAVDSAIEDSDSRKIFRCWQCRDTATTEIGVRASQAKSLAVWLAKIVALSPKAPNPLALPIVQILIVTL
jgi:hypothetical protein